MSLKVSPKHGFATLPPDRMREIAASGGIASHRQGRAHRWNAEEARVAGRKGGFAARGRRKSKVRDAQEG